MTIDEFRSSLSDPRPPEGLPGTLQAMWYDARGDWDKAHDIAQEIGDSSGSWIHAYLHRKEGDEWNAAYWYRRAGKPVPSGLSLQEEWEQITAHFLSGN